MRKIVLTITDGSTNIDTPEDGVSGLDIANSISALIGVLMEEEGMPEDTVHALLNEAVGHHTTKREG